jgi:hypothetical protein
VYTWQKKGILAEELAVKEMLLGSLGYWALVLLVASSIPVVRRLAHGFFKVSLI